ncbi:MAG: helicase-exonuclease AddAB subunit AddA [Streptococcaceae bacterium]|jgi:ATP-dependent helicase/nuclease subunit A|nr:helicase-exonuclease AddAB subunit AddA [Streptococcaceae bacterium]
MSNIPLKPENSIMTDAQWQAIYDKGDNILVSASAGSGKTFVLVERVIQKVLSGVDVNKLLIVTFTEAAAAEMKERLEKKIIETINETKEANVVKHLQKQLQLLPQANISTMHAFCMTVIRRFYYLIDIDPVFRMLIDPTEISLMKEKVWNELRESLYEIDGKKNEAFYHLTNNFSNDKNDQGLQDLVFSLYEFSRSHPNPERYLQGLVENYQLNNQDITQTPLYQKVIYPQLQQDVFALNQLTTQMENLSHELFYEEMIPVIAGRRAQIKDYQKQLQGGYQAMVEFLKTLEDFKHVNKRPKEGKEILKAFNECNKDIREYFRKIQKTIFRFEHELMEELMLKSQDLIALLVEVTQGFTQGFAKEKREKNSVDFSDLEHFAIQILTQKQDDGSFLPSAASNYYRELFEEVLIDEYQDTNMIQETIAKYVSKENNRFMVGDVKQSIYMFRQADPSLFIEKYNHFSKNQGGRRIVLPENFRSRSDVLDFTNLVFRQLMNTTLGQIDYDEAARLVVGNKTFPQTQQMQTQFLIYEKNNDEEETDEALEVEIEIEDKDHGEITMIAMKIQQLMQEKTQIYDKKLEKNRLLEYSDIVLLTPTRKQNITIQEVFEDFGIPVMSNDADTYFKRTEILTMLAVLQIIDNPYQDIALAAVLRSPIVGLLEDELAQIRLNDLDGYYYEAMQATKTLPKLEKFKNLLIKWRKFARQVSLNDLIWMIFEDTAHVDYVAGLNNGKQRQANLYALADIAKSFEQMSFRGLFQFIRFIQSRQEREQDLAEPVSIGEENSVRIMTIHGSKGLEFPFVFLMNTSKEFNEQDLRGKFIFDDKLGIGIQYIDQMKRLKYSTFVYEAIKQERKNKLLSEEMRKLYVALTRAEQKLFIVGSAKSKEKLLKKWQVASDAHQEVLPLDIRLKANNMLDWIGMTLVRHRDFEILNPAFDIVVNGEVKNHPGNFTFEFFQESDLTKIELGKFEPLKKSDENLSNVKEELAKAQVRLAFDYQEKVAIHTTNYQSVSEIKRIFADPDEPNFLYSSVESSGTFKANRIFADELAKPSFLTTKKSQITAAQIGTVSHFLLQEMDFSVKQTKESLQALLDEAIKKGQVDKDLAKQVKLPKLLEFLASEFGQFIIENHEHLVREKPFSMLMNPKDIFGNYPQNTQDDLLIHGIIDGYVMMEQGIVLFDYKTDHVSSTSKQALEKVKERHQGQMNLYKKALELATGQKVIRSVIVLLSKNVVIEM